ncbi:MAG: Crp/Fnr family transcriptional regulator [Brevundimonas sp.]
MSLESVLGVSARPYREAGLARPPWNTLLSHIEPEVWIDLRHCFEEVRLAVGDAPVGDGQVWFPTSAVLGLKVSGACGEAIDVALAGRDAVASNFPGLAPASGQISGRWVVRLGGAALRTGADHLARLKAQSAPLAAALDRQEAGRVPGLLNAALCGSAHRLDGRMASLLLRLMDGAGRREFEISQEALAEMLGVQRTTLSAVASDFKSLHLIRYARGRIQVLDPEGLRHRACEHSAGSHVPNDGIFRSLEPRNGTASFDPRQDQGL